MWYYKHAFFRRWEYLMCWFRVFALLDDDDGASLFHIVNTGIIVLSRVAFLSFSRGSPTCVCSPSPWASPIGCGRGRVSPLDKRVCMVRWVQKSHRRLPPLCSAFRN